eukprot:scaffold228813_cov24-Attheya_sp.AAC.1
MIAVCRFNLEVFGDGTNIDGHGFEIFVESSWKTIEKEIEFYGVSFINIVNTLEKGGLGVFNRENTSISDFSRLFGGGRFAGSRNRDEISVRR